MTLATGFHTIYQHIPAMPGIKKKEIIKKKKCFSCFSVKQKVYAKMMNKAYTYLSK